MQVQFYHLLSTPLEAALPKLAAKAYEQGMRVNIVASPDMLALLDRTLWTYDPASFLPHGLEDADAGAQPILLSVAPSRANGATMLMITSGAVLEAPQRDGYTRVFDLFDGHDNDQLTQARARWKAYQQEGLGLTYIRQQDSGGWEKVQEIAPAAA